MKCSLNILHVKLVNDEMQPEHFTCKTSEMQPKHFTCKTDQ